MKEMVELMECLGAAMLLEVGLELELSDVSVLEVRLELELSLLEGEAQASTRSA